MKLQLCNKIFLDTGHVPPPLRGRGRDEVCEVLSELVGTKVERISITRLVTKQSTSSSSLRHDTDCLGLQERGEGK